MSAIIIVLQFAACTGFFFLPWVFFGRSERLRPWDRFVLSAGAMLPVILLSAGGTAELSQGGIRRLAAADR